MQLGIARPRHAGMAGIVGLLLVMPFADAAARQHAACPER